MSYKMGKVRGFACTIALLVLSAVNCAAAVHTNPLNLDPMVQEAFHRFYQLDYPAAVELFERVHNAHPGDPQATALLLDAVLFQELYRQDLLDTTFYANDGFLTGKHATELPVARPPWACTTAGDRRQPAARREPRPPPPPSPGLLPGHGRLTGPEPVRAVRLCLLPMTGPAIGGPGVTQ